jgi:hypothetical protein
MTTARPPAPRLSMRCRGGHRLDMKLVSSRRALFCRDYNPTIQTRTARG